MTKTAFAHGADPAWFALGRAALSGFGGAVALAVLGRLRVPGRADLPALLVLGLCQLAGFFALSHAGLSLVPAGRTGVLANATPVWVVPLSLLLLREPIPPRRWIAAGSGVLGVVVLAGPWAIEWAAPGALAGHALLLGAALNWALAMVAVRRWPPRLPMLELLPWGFALACAALLPLAWAHAPGRWDGVATGALVLIGLVAGPFGTWCVLQATVSLPAVVTSVGFLGTPVLGLVFSALWLGEAVTPDLLAGAALILGGAVVGAWPGRAGTRAPGRGPGWTRGRSRGVGR